MASAASGTAGSANPKPLTDCTNAANNMTASTQATAVLPTSGALSGP
jgi:hypothetical protein